MRPLIIIGVIMLLPLSYITAMKNFLLFHIMIEFIVVMVSLGISLVTLSAVDTVTSGFLRFIGTAFLFIGVLEAVHTVAYKGMGIFPGLDADYPTQLWIAARWMEVITFALAVYRRNARVRVRPLFIVYALVTVVLLFLIMGADVFPSCFIEGSGLTPFKKISEYLISGIFLCLTIHFIVAEKNFPRDIRTYIILSLLFSALAEILFTFYISVYGISNYAGHVMKATSVFMIFLAIVRKGIKEPRELLYYDLLQKEASLEEALEEKEILMREMNHRVKNSLNLVTSLVDLQAFNTENAECGRKMAMLKKRIASVSLIHEKLSSSEKVGEILFSAYVKDLLDNIVDFSGIESGSIALDVDIPDIYLPARQAIPLGIILNELVTNSFKYAFPEGMHGRVSIAMEQRAGVYALRIEDNGRGQRKKKGHQPSGLGTTLVASLVDQLEGELSVDSIAAPHPDSGTRYCLEIPL